MNNLTYPDSFYFHKLFKKRNLSQNIFEFNKTQQLLCNTQHRTSDTHTYISVIYTHLCDLCLSSKYCRKVVKRGRYWVDKLTIQACLVSVLSSTEHEQTIYRDEPNVQNRLAIGRPSAWPTGSGQLYHTSDVGPLPSIDTSKNICVYMYVCIFLYVSEATWPWWKGTSRVAPIKTIKRYTPLQVMLTGMAPRRRLEYWGCEAGTC